MRTYLRYAVSVRVDKFPYKAPKEIEDVSDEVYDKCKKYAIGDKFVLIPVDVPEYDMVMDFKKLYSEYAYKLTIYEHKFTKKEMESADYYLLKSQALVLPKKSSPSMFGRCCAEKTLIGDQKGYYIIGKNDMSNKVITFTGPGRFFISVELKEAMETMVITNTKFIPVYSYKMQEILAYQLEAEHLFPTLDEYNHWGVYKQCPNCHRTIHNTIHSFPNPFTIPYTLKNNLKDINATTEVFTEGQARHYIISRRVYDLLLSMGAKKLICEPIVFI